MNNLNQRKILSGLCHGSGFFSYLIVFLGIPIAILFITDDPVVKANAKESLNFHINLYLYALIFTVLIFVLIGIPLLILLYFAGLAMTIVALVKVLDNPDKPYRYPFIFRLF